MDRNYYYEKMQKQREREISDLLKQPREDRHEPITRKQAQRMVLRLAIAVIVLSGLVIILL